MRFLPPLALLVAGCPEVNFPEAHADAAVADAAEEAPEDAADAALPPDAPGEPPPLPSFARQPADCWRRELSSEGGAARIRNTCRFCHGAPRSGNPAEQRVRQRFYPEDPNPWPNAFAGEKRFDATLTATRAELRALLTGWNGDPPREGRMRYYPDLGLGAGLVGLDADGFSPTGFRALAWQPFPHPSFWPRTGGAVHVAFIRLPANYGTRGGMASWDAYSANLERLREALGGAIFAPSTYGDDAAALPRLALRYPIGTELVLVRTYIDPDCATPPCRSTRWREVQMLVKTQPADAWEAFFTGGGPGDSVAGREGAAALAAGRVDLGNGWEAIGFLEGPGGSGDLRPQTAFELAACAGCHGAARSPADGAAIPASLDGTFAVPRQLPGTEGWGLMAYRHRDFFNRRSGRPELDDVLEDLFDEPPPTLDASGMVDPLVYFPAEARAADLGRRYRQIVEGENFAEGREPFLEDDRFIEIPPDAEPGDPGGATGHGSDDFIPSLDFSRWRKP